MSTVKHYRSVLMHLFHTLDGKAGRNPVRDTRLPREPRPEPRALDYPTIERLLTAIDEPLVDARLRVLAYTGLPPAGIMRLERRDVDLRQGFLRLRPRRKGQGTGPHVVPLSRHGKAALRRFVQLDAFGPFDWSHVGKVFRRACRTLGLVGVRPYDLRHSFGTLVYEQTGDLRAAQLLLGHASQVTTTRYTLAAEARRLRIVARQIDEGLGSQLPTAQPQRKAGRISVGVARGSAAGTRRTPA